MMLLLLLLLLLPSLGEPVTLQCATVRALSRATTGTQDFTSSGLGTPKAAIIVANWATGDDTTTQGTSFAIGMTDGTNQVVGSFSSADANATTTNTDKRRSETNCVAVLTPGTQTAVGLGACSAITDGIQINWSAVPATQREVQVLLLGGDAISNAFAGGITASASIDGTVDNTGVGFQADDVLIVHINVDNATFTATGQRFAFGAVHRDGLVHRSMAQDDRDAQTSTQLSGSLHTGSIKAIYGNSATSVGHELSAFDSQGFTITTRTEAIERRLEYLALQYAPGVTTALATLTSPTSTGNTAHTGAGGTPQCALWAHTLNQAVDTRNVDGQAGSIAVNFITSTVQYSANSTSQDAITLGTTNTSSLSDDTAIHMLQHDQTAGLAAAFTSFTADTMTLNWNPVLGAATQGWVLFFNTPPAATGQKRTQSWQ